MKALLSKITLCIALILTSLVTGVGNAYAASCASPAANQINCIVNQQMTQNGGGDGFGGIVRLGQTFKPSASKRLCKVDVLIQKNNANAGALALKLSGGGLMPVATVIAAPAIPLATPRWVTFNFGCAAGPLLQAGVTYFLELSAGNSPANAYTWINSNAGYANGAGWRNAGAGWVLLNVDYAFKVYLCY